MNKRFSSIICFLESFMTDFQGFLYVWIFALDMTQMSMFPNSSKHIDIVSENLKKWVVNRMLLISLKMLIIQTNTMTTTWFHSWNKKIGRTFKDCPSKTVFICSKTSLSKIDPFEEKWSEFFYANNWKNTLNTGFHKAQRCSFAV